MKKLNIMSFILLIASVIVTIIAYFVLPNTVVTQISKNGNKTMSKISALLIPMAFSVGGAIFGICTKQNQSLKIRGILASICGIVLFILLFIFN